MNKLSRERLKKWFKNNCTDVGHIYYGQIMSLLTPVPEEKLKEFVEKCYARIMEETSGDYPIFGEDDFEEILQAYDNLREGKEE